MYDRTLQLSRAPAAQPNVDGHHDFHAFTYSALDDFSHHNEEASGESLTGTDTKSFGYPKSSGHRLLHSSHQY